MASNKQNSEEKKKELAKSVAAKFVHDGPTTDELDLNKDRMLERSDSLSKSGRERPKSEAFKCPDGRVIVTELVYNTKQGDIETKNMSQYKTAMCTYFESGRCANGPGCRFAHTEEELNKYKGWYDDAKKLLNDHRDPCNNQQCSIKLRLLLEKMVLCGFWKENNCWKTDSTCTFAHGEHEIVPLPKYEICRNYQRDGCNFANTECVYAHGAKEKIMRGAAVIRVGSITSPLINAMCSLLHT